MNVIESVFMLLVPGPLSAPAAGESASHSARQLVQLLARRNAIDITAAVCHTAADLMLRAQAHPGTHTHHTDTLTHTQPQNHIHINTQALVYALSLLQAQAQPSNTDTQT